MDHHDWQRGRSRGHRHYEDDDEAQPVYIGVPVSHRRKRRRHHSYASDTDHAPRHSHYDHHTHGEHTHRGYYHDREEHYVDEEESTEHHEHIDPTVSPAAERLRNILGEDDGTPTPTIFTEMDTLQHEGGELEWKESARWVKFEEKVEEGGERWSKPHVSTLTLHSLFELRTCLQTGSILLDLEGYSLPQIVGESRSISLKGQLQCNMPQHVISTHAFPPAAPPCLFLQLKNKFMKKIPRDAEASNVLIGEVDFLDKPFVSFVRLAQATTLGGLTEVPVPTRFLFILLGPHGKTKSYNEIGRAIATLMVDDLFSDVAYKARDRDDLIAGVDEFLDEVIVLPPGEWDPKIRIEPPKKVPSAEMRHVLQLKVGGGLWLDIKRKIPWYCSDIYDGFHIQSISAVLFIYLGCITNAITFGGLLGDATDNYQGVMESFLGTALAGTVFCLFGGQPLIILSSTGPILIFEKLLYEFSKSNNIDYMELRLWIGLHSCLQCFLLVVSDASYIIKYMTRFTEEGFSSLISFIFISDAIKKMVAFKYYPINRGFKPDYITAYKCECIAPDQGECSDSLITTEYLDWSQLSKKECVKYGGTLVGNSCKYVPDLALMSFILFFGTYSMTVSLKKFKFSRYFPTKLRSLISDFAIIISILVFCGLDCLLELDTPKLHVPTEIKPTRPDRGWLVMPFGKNPWWWYLASFVPALLVTILIFMDQQISAVIVNRKENKLKKGCGYHLDLFWVGILMAVCSFMGLPWYVAATVISIAHIDSLKMESESSAPGEQPQFLGVREQRFTGTLVFVLTGLSVFLAPVLQYIPMPVLYGVFLYMGVASLSGIQFWERIKLYLMPAKHQPDFSFLRHVPLRRVHLFTLVQIVCLAVLWILKSTFLAIIFPVMILGLMVVRKLLDLMFSQHDLAWLDDILPDKDKKKKEDEKKKIKEKKAVEPESDEEVRGNDFLPNIHSFYCNLSSFLGI
uniref:Anion exchange protein n=1 Tax=Lates calcarifer TaxID=8187 RepID=A0A4W6F5E4_LATCA